VINVEDRLRPISEAGVESVMASIEELGLKDEIIVRKVRHQDGRLVLVAGAHRLEAFRRLGRDVPAKIYDCADDWARMMEVDDNLAGAELGGLDTAVFLAERKRVFEKLHPETKAGVAGGLARQGLASDTMSFAKATAEKFGVSRRHVERLVSAGMNLKPEEVAQLRAAPKAVALKDLVEIGKIGEAEERAFVVRALSESQAKNPVCRMRAFGVVICHSMADLGAGICAGLKRPQIDAFVFQASPKPFHEDVVEEPALAVHRDAHARLAQPVRPGKGGELAALIHCPAGDLQSKSAGRGRNLLPACSRCASPAPCACANPSLSGSCCA